MIENLIIIVVIYSFTTVGVFWAAYMYIIDHGYITVRDILIFALALITAPGIILWVFFLVLDHNYNLDKKIWEK